MGRAVFRHPAPWVFVILLGSYAYFWHSRDWNTASRLMLTYALVDRGTLSIDGLDRHTGDKAYVDRHYFSDKLPGFSLLAVVPYATLKWIFGWPDHPLGLEAFPYWPADYWVTVFTSGLLTAGTGVVLVSCALKLNCSPRNAALVGLAYGLATPAFVYGTLAYGHQASAFALLSAFRLLWDRAKHPALAMSAAGFLAAYASLIELQVGPVSAIIALDLLIQCLSGQRRSAALGQFIVGALFPTLILLGYNALAFGSPFDMGYFHHATAEFAQVHSKDNPLGLRAPDWTKVIPLLWGPYRGLTFYAPILWLAVPGWFVLFRARQFRVAIVSLLVVSAVFIVNLSYPEWTGGWTTGPRLLVPLFPFAMLPVAALLGLSGRWSFTISIAATALSLWGGCLMLLFQGASGRIPHELGYPLSDLVWPLWRGMMPVPGWYHGFRFCRNPLSVLAPGWVATLPPRWEFLQFLPLILFQTAMIAMAWRALDPANQNSRIISRRPIPPTLAAQSPANPIPK